jgi:hypothetical protein
MKNFNTIQGTHDLRSLITQDARLHMIKATARQPLGDPAMINLLADLNRGKMRLIFASRWLIRIDNAMNKTAT